MLLGEVVNVVAKFAQEGTNERKNFMEEVYGPSVKLLKYYFTQVSHLFSVLVLSLSLNG